MPRFLNTRRIPVPLLKSRRTRGIATMFDRDVGSEPRSLFVLSTYHIRILSIRVSFCFTETLRHCGRLTKSTRASLSETKSTIAHVIAPYKVSHPQTGFSAVRRSQLEFRPCLMDSQPQNRCLIYHANSLQPKDPDTQQAFPMLSTNFTKNRSFCSSEQVTPLQSPSFHASSISPSIRLELRCSSKHS